MVIFFGTIASFDWYCCSKNNKKILHFLGFVIDGKSPYQFLYICVRISSEEDVSIPMLSSTNKHSFALSWSPWLTRPSKDNFSSSVFNINDWMIFILALKMCSEVFKEFAEPFAGDEETPLGCNEVFIDCIMTFNSSGVSLRVWPIFPYYSLLIYVLSSVKADDQRIIFIVFSENCH